MATSLVIEHGQLASLQTASLTAWLAFAYTVLFGAVAGWGLWFWLIARCSMTRLAPFALLQIVFAVAAGVVFLNERMTPSLVIGAVLCIIGVAISQSRSAARPGVPAAPRMPVVPIRGDAGERTDGGALERRRRNVDCTLHSHSIVPGGFDAMF